MAMFLALDEQKRIIKDHQKTAPVHVVPLASAFGIEVFYVDSWPNNVSGMIRRNPRNRDQFQIYANGTHAATRRRFTIAHEIAHALMHPFDIGDGIQEDALLRSGLPDRMEFQANRMAADILMPWHLLRPVLDSGVSDVQELAKRFWVSQQAMAIRLGVPQGEL